MRVEKNVKWNIDSAKTCTVEDRSVTRTTPTDTFYVEAQKKLPSYYDLLYSGTTYTVE